MGLGVGGLVCMWAARFKVFFVWFGALWGVFKDWYSHTKSGPDGQKCHW